MLPVPLLDVTARAAVYEGYNDNVVETRPAPDLPTQRRGSPFTGLDVSIDTTSSGPSGMWSVRLGARGQHYTPLSDRLVGGDDGTLSLGWNGGFEAGPVTNVSVGQSLMLSGQNTARLADMPMLTLDPALGRQTFLVASNDVAWQRELTSVQRVRVTLTGVLRYMLYETSPDGAGRGIDYVGPRIVNEWVRDLGPSDTGSLRLNLGVWYTPRAVLDLSGRRGPTQTWQATPTVGWGHQLGESWHSEIQGGISFVTTTSDAFTSSTVMPALAAQLSYTEEQRFAQFSYGLGIDTASMSFGPGLSHSLGALYGGPLSRVGTWRRFVAGLTASASRASIPTTSSTSFMVTTAGVGGLLQYAIGDWVGIIVGYEGQHMNMGQAGGDLSSSVTFYRNVAYVGISTSASTTPGALPIDVPRPPPR